MHGKVKRLRQRGARLSDRDIANAPFAEGDLVMANLAGTMLLEVKNRNSTSGEPLIPTLYEPRITGMHGNKMMFKGEERPQGDAGPAYVQEWSVLIDAS
jgi:hypothetical protein